MIKSFKNLSSKTTLFFTKPNFIFPFCLFIILSLSRLEAQYKFSLDTGTFKPLSGGTKILSDGNEWKLVNLGFNFNYNGVEYDKVIASSTGCLSFDLRDFSYYSNFSSGKLMIAPLLSNLSRSGGTASYKTEGTGLNRTFTFEWLNWRWNSNATQAGISFQVKLYETTNRIEFIYRNELDTVANPYLSIGLLYQLKGQVYALVVYEGETVIHAVNYFSSYFKGKLRTGQIFRFDEDIKPEPAYNATEFTNPANLTLKWKDALGTDNRYRYLIKVSNKSLDSIKNPLDGIVEPDDLNLRDGDGSVYVNNYVQKFSGWTDSIGNTTFFIKIFTATNEYGHINYKTDGNVPSLKIDVPPYQAQMLNFSNINSSSITLNWKGDLNTKAVVFVKENGTGMASPINNTTYLSNEIFGTGTQIDTTGWFCVYNGLSNNITVKGLKKLTKYSFHVLEYTGSPGNEQYSTESSPSSYSVQSTNLFTEIPIAPALTDPFWADYDNDGDLDILTDSKSSSGHMVYLQNNGKDSLIAKEMPILNLTRLNSIEDYDNDGDLDILSIGWEELEGNQMYTYTAKVFQKESGNAYLMNKVCPSTDIWDIGGYSAFVDYNNDGLKDVIFKGSAGGFKIQMYKNTGVNKFVRDTDFTVRPSAAGSIHLADFDNDGYTDFLELGEAYQDNEYAELYRNNGSGMFVKHQGISIDDLSSSSAAWGDYNSDGYIDLLISGKRKDGSVMTSIFKNNGNGSFTELKDAISKKVYSGGIGWGDYNNDGLLDVLVSGRINDDYISAIFKNNGDGTFSEQTNILLPGIRFAQVRWGDYDNDGDLDLLLAGAVINSPFVKLFRNDISAPNQVPAPPSTLLSAVNKSDVTLSWSRDIYDATPSKGLTYNIRIGSSPGNCNIVSPLADEKGFRRVVRMGNAETDTSFTLHNLQNGTYYWSVQAVDNCFAGGSFATEQLFTVTEGITPTPSTRVITNNKNENFLYPNPASDILYLKNLTKGSYISIYSSEGKMVKSLVCNENTIKIFVNDLPQGIYILRAKNPTNELQLKFLKL